MQYIGNKQTLVESIHNIMNKYGVVGESFMDLFAGTQSVGIYFKKHGYKIISNDWQYYSYVLGKAFIENNEKLNFENICNHLEIEPSYENILEYLNNVEGIDGFIYENFCPTGSKDKEYQRLYFLDENGRKFDAIRTQLNVWKTEDLLNENEYFFLLATLIESMDKVSNTTSVYGAFLKEFKHASAKELELKPLTIIESNKENETYCSDGLEFIKEHSADIIYMDPPYNTRQYASNYHLLETMALYDNPVLHGKTGMREYSNQKSPFSSKTLVKKFFSDIIDNIDKTKVKFVVMSYNNEGILPEEYIISEMSKYGEVIKEEIDYKRYRSDKDREDRKYKADKVKEYVFILKIKQE